MSTGNYTLVYDFSTLGKFGDPHPRNNLKDLPVVAAGLAGEDRNKVEEVVNETWKRNFVAFYDCQNTDTQGYVFTDAPKDANLIVLAFRGSTSVADYFIDAFVVLKPIATPDNGDYAVVNVHTGFWDALSREDDVTIVYKAGGEQELKAGPAFGTIRDTLVQLASDNPNAKILVTGHSLGAALALMFSLKLSFEHREMMGPDKYKLINFGQPKIGDSKFKGYINSLGLNYTRVVYRADAIPALPLGLLLPYYHVGTLLNYYNKDATQNPVDEEINGEDHDINGYVSSTKDSLDPWKAAEMVWADPLWGWAKPAGPWAISQPAALAAGLKIKERQGISTATKKGRLLRTQVMMQEDITVQKVRNEMIQMVRQELVQKMLEEMLEGMRK